MPEQVVYTLPEAGATPVAASTDGTWVYEPNHAGRMAARLIEFFRKPRNMAMLQYVVGPRIQNLEDTLWEMSTAFSLDTGTGQALDWVGGAVGELRQGRTDTAYRVAIRARILVNNSEGTPEQLLEIITTAQNPITVRAVEHYPASILYTWTSTFDDITARNLYTLVRQAKPAGVGLHAVIAPAAGGFLWSTTAAAGGASSHSFATIVGGDGGDLQEVLG